MTRFAPSPTGPLHEGHLLHLEWLRAVAEVTGARILVRMEDHDRGRCRPEFEQSILDDLVRSGLPVEPESLASLQGPPPSSFRQSDNPARYQAAFDQLREMGLLYACTCTRGDLAPPDEFGERHYPGTCRGQPLEREGRHVVRVMLPDQPTAVDDLLLGAIHQYPLRDHGDPVIRDAMGQWTYQLCVVVDDIDQKVNLIVRGRDLLTSTGRQVLLRHLLGSDQRFVTLHHPLVLDEHGRKLSKRTARRET
ncbi:MAG TPA: glutamate--tRNA ligase family protein [Gemmatimonadales bacterium]|nr:glutamate--tRNA ligase family protein [Gemmatimonadales bacterium]